MGKPSQFLMLSSDSSLQGPDQPTLVEKLVGSTGLPYWASCVLIGCLIGAPGYFLFYFLDTLDPAQALKELTSSAFFSIGQFGQPLSLADGLAVSVLATVFFILTLYFVRYMRLISRDVESGIAKLCPEYSEQTYHQTFGGLSDMKFVILLAAVFSLAYAPPRIMKAGGISSMLSALILIPLDFLAVGAALWIYLRSLWGVYKLGSRHLSLAPYHQDRMLGLHPIGAMTLSFGIVYLTLDTTALAAGVITADIPNLLVLCGLLFLLALMLFLPVYGIHTKMRAEKDRQKAELQSRISEISMRTTSGTPEVEEAALSDLKYLLAYRTLSSEVAKIPAWPFETGRLERFLAVFLSITAIIIARLIQLAFHF